MTDEATEVLCSILGHDGDWHITLEIEPRVHYRFGCWRCGIDLPEPLYEMRVGTAVNDINHIRSTYRRVR